MTVAGERRPASRSVNYTVAVNSTSAARTGTMSVAGKTVTVNQAFGNCNYTVNPLTVTALSFGLSGSVSVITRTSSHVDGQIPVTTAGFTVAGGTHAGLASVNYTVAVNSTSAARTGTTTVAGKTRPSTRHWHARTTAFSDEHYGAPDGRYQPHYLDFHRSGLHVDGDELSGLDHDYEQREREGEGIGHLHGRAGHRAAEGHAHGRRPDGHHHGGDPPPSAAEDASTSSADTAKGRPAHARR